MAASTSPDTITYPTSTDQVAPLENVFATMATSVQNALTNFRNNTTYNAADLAARNTRFPSPTQGASVWRVDLNQQETYSALYNATTNPGGRTPAGWYTEPRVQGFTITGVGDANGYTSTITHTLGKTPDWVVVSWNYTVSDVVSLIAAPIVWDKSATTIRIRIRRTDTNTWFTGNGYNVSVFAGIN